MSPPIKKLQIRSIEDNKKGRPVIKGLIDGHKVRITLMDDTNEGRRLMTYLFCTGTTLFLQAEEESPLEKKFRVEAPSE